MRSRSLTRRQVVASLGVSAVVAMQVQHAHANDATPVASPQSEDLPLVEVALLTGSDPAAINQTGTEYGVDGADLGSSFLYNDQTYIVFGDSFDIGKSDWRSNLLAISS